MEAAWPVQVQSQVTPQSRRPVRRRSRTRRQVRSARCTRSSYLAPPGCRRSEIVLSPNIIIIIIIYKDFIRVDKAEMTLLGAPVLKGSAQDAAIKHKIDDRSRAIERLTLLKAHDALAIPKNSLAIPRLLYLLRTSDCGDNRLLREFDNTLQSGLTSILNDSLSLVCSICQ